MKLVVQRVSAASVEVLKTKKVVGSVEGGLFVLVGIKKGDSLKDAEFLAGKLVKLRVMADENGKMNLVAHDFLVVSQFTLHADTKGGNRPSFIDAAGPNDAQKIYVHFVSKLKEKAVRVEKGSFGDDMKIEATLDGPVTIILES